ncbi:MAG TPA: hypothetical protein VLF91_04000 [Candidatus Saccharimonadales bacterium]|nr:hypothetical protein [Candidatus Saccharimonadales bacterium]
MDKDLELHGGPETVTVERVVPYEVSVTDGDVIDATVVEDPNRALLEANADVIRRFVVDYILDTGVGVQLIEQAAKTLFGQYVAEGGTVSDDSTPAEIIRKAMNDIVRVTVVLFSVDIDYSLDGVIGGAVSLELLVRYARLVHGANPNVIPADVIPSDELVNAALALFHAGKAAGKYGFEDDEDDDDDEGSGVMDVFER